MAVHLELRHLFDLRAHRRIRHHHAQFLVEVQQQLPVDQPIQRRALHLGLFEVRRIHGVAGLRELLLPVLVEAVLEILLRNLVAVDLGHPGLVAGDEIGLDAEEREHEHHQAEDDLRGPAAEFFADLLQHGNRIAAGTSGQL